MAETPSLKESLRRQLEAGVDETIGEAPVDRYAASLKPAEPPQVAAAQRRPAAPPTTAEPSPARPPAPPGGGDAVANARALAASARTLEDLRDALVAFDGCALKETATNLVFGDGNPEARVMFVGEAPGSEEDRQGLPFVGLSGRLLDRMIASIGLDRGSAYITNVLTWRPPGNRSPTTAEIAACLPFTERHVEIVDPDVLVLVGGTAAKTMLGRAEGIMKLRGRWIEYSSHGLARAIPAIAIFHSAYLLRSPAHKREAWRDLLAIKAKLDSLTLR